MKITFFFILLTIWFRSDANGYFCILNRYWSPGFYLLCYRCLLRKSWIWLSWTH
jgi:hypothetical protein